MLKKLYTQIDFTNLTSEDIKKIISILDVDIPKEKDKYEYLYENMSVIESNQEAKNILNNKILSGQPTVKWYKYKYDEDITKDILISKLESKELGFNVDIRERKQSHPEIKDDIVNIISEGHIYIIKIFISDGYKRYNNGIESRKEEMIKSVIVKIDIENCWVEIRTNALKSRKVEKILESRLGLINLKGVRILNNHKNDIATFKDSLIDGVYLSYKATPSQVIKLREEDGITIATIIRIIDDYLVHKNGEALLDRLDELNYDREGLSFISLLLAGIDNLGMKIKNDSEKDMSEQSLYTILKDQFIEDSSYIRFKAIPNGDEYTMRVGLKTNSIIFKSSVTEEVITYIREKVL